jgi:hypothetical protein
MPIRNITLAVVLGTSTLAAAMVGPISAGAQNLPVVSDWLCSTTKGSPLLVGRLHLIVLKGTTVRGTGATATGQLVTFGATLKGNSAFGTFTSSAQTGWIKLTFESPTSFNGFWGAGQNYDHPLGALVGKYQTEQVVPPG